MGEQVSKAEGRGLPLRRRDRRGRPGSRPSAGFRRQVARALSHAGPLRSTALLPALDESQAWPAERMQQLQLELLRRILPPGSGAGPTSIDDVAELPVMTRDDLSRRPSRAPGRRVSTSGTGGSPQRILWSLESMRWQDAVDERSRDWLGVRGWDRRVWICCNPAGPLRRGHLALANTRIVEAGEIGSSEDARRRLADRLAADPPDLLQGVSNALAAVADELAANGRRLPGTRWLSAGNHLTPWYRRRISRLTPGPVAERYAAVEVGLIASSCERGSLHVNSENLLVEVVGADGRALHDRAGEVLLTTLRNRTAPLVRYAVGDVAVLRSTACGCGRTLPVIEPAGRLQGLGFGDFPVDPRPLFDAIDADGVLEARVLQGAGGSIDVEVVLDPNADRRPLLSRIERDAARLLDSVEVRARTVARIEPATSGKIRHIGAVTRPQDQATSSHARRQ